MPGARQEQFQPQGREAIIRPVLPSTPKTIFIDRLHVQNITRWHFSDQKQEPEKPKKNQGASREDVNPWEYTAQRRAPTKAEKRKQPEDNATVKRGKHELTAEEIKKNKEAGIRYDKNGKRI